MSNLLDFLDKVDAEAESKKTSYSSRGGSGDGTFQPQFINWFTLSEANKKYIFSVIDMGTQLYTHQMRWPEKPMLCSKLYYKEDCPECEKESGFKNKRKVKQADGSEEEIEVMAKKKPTRTHYMICYLHNHTGGTRTAKNDETKTYATNPVVLSNWACGEANTQNKMEKDRNIKNILNIKDLGCLDSTVFEISRSVVMEKGKEKKITHYPSVLPEKAVISYEIPGIGLTKNPVSKLVVPSDIQAKFDDMTIYEKSGLILNMMDNVRKDFWEKLGVVFPKEQEAKPADDSKEEPEDL